MSQTHYTQLSLEERVVIENRLKNGENLSRIARAINRDKSTLSREIKRNGTKSHKTRVNMPFEANLDGRNFRGTEFVDTIRDKKERYNKRLNEFSKPLYNAHRAQEKAQERIKQQTYKLDQKEYEPLKDFVLEKLEINWSPEEISGRLTITPNLPYVSPKAIYKFVYERKLERYLRRKGRRKCTIKALKYNKTNRDKHNISEREEIVNTLGRYGDLEGDTIFGKDSRDRILTHVDRLTGVLSGSLIKNYDAAKVSKQTVEDITRVFGDVETITYDNGSEFSLWKETEKKLGATIYFANAYHSWERGRNENANGLIREYFPKGTDFKKLTQSDILRVVDLINNRPRKRFHWLTPLEYRESLMLRLRG